MSINPLGLPASKKVTEKKKQNDGDSTGPCLVCRRALQLNQALIQQRNELYDNELNQALIQQRNELYDNELNQALIQQRNELYDNGRDVILPARCHTVGSNSNQDQIRCLKHMENTCF